MKFYENNEELVVKLIVQRQFPIRRSTMLSFLSQANECNLLFHISSYGVTLASLGAVFQTDLTYSGDSLPLHRLGFLQPLFFKKVNVILSILWLDAKIYFV